MIRREFWFGVCGYFSIVICAAGVEFQISYLKYFYFFFLFSILIIFFAHLLDIGRYLLGLKANVSTAWLLKLSAMAYVILLLLTTFFLTNLSPGASWDFLSYWSIEILTHLPGYQLPNQIGQGFEANKHPWIMSGAITSALTLGQIPGHPGFFWFGLLCINLASLKSIAELLNLGPIALLAAFLVSLSPLAENHYALFGYAEAGLIVGISIFITFTHFAFKYNSGSHFLFAILTALSLSAVKTSGFFLSFICIFSIVLSYFSKRTRGAGLVFILVLFGFFALLYFIIFHQGTSIAMLKTGTVLHSSPVSDLIDIFVQAFMYNQSFSVSAMASLICVVYLTRSVCNPNNSSGLFCVGYILCGVLGVGIIFTLTEYGLGHSLPNHDTSFSRLLLSQSSPLAILVLYIIKDAGVNHSEINRSPFTEGFRRVSHRIGETRAKSL